MPGSDDYARDVAPAGNGAPPVRRWPGAILAVCGLLPVSCSPESPDSGPSQKTLSLDLADTVERLDEVSTAEQGVWALLRHLGIGVYQADGTQVMAGSETGPDDFWLHDFQVDLLARAAHGEPRPFAALHARFRRLGYQGSPEQLASIYRNAYAEHPDSLIARLFGHMDVDFSAPPALTPLQEWVLLLDTFVPPNGGSSSLALDIFLAPARAADCGTIVGGEIRPNWGVVRDASDLAALLAAEESYAALHATLLVAGIRGELEAGAAEVHEGHGGPGERVAFTARVELDYDPQDMPVEGASCGHLTNLNRSLIGPMPDAGVIWEASGAFAAHGELDMPSDGVTPTDASGRASIAFQARREPANGEGERRSATATVKAYVDPGQVLRAQVGSVNPRLLLALPERVEIGVPQTITISWHHDDETEEPETTAIPAGRWAGTIADAVDIEYSSLDSASLASGPIEFTVAAGEVDGEWRTSGSGESTMKDGRGVYAFTNRGRVLGTATEPRVRFTGAQFDQEVTVTIDGQSFTHADSRIIEPEEDETARPLPVDNVSCEMVTGRWSLKPFGHVAVNGWFMATRVGDLSEEDVEAYRTAMASLMEQGHRLRERLPATGTVNAMHLDALLTHAEDLRKSIERGMICGESGLDRFISPLETMLTDILDLAIENPDALDAVSLRRLVTAATEVGALKSESASDLEDADRRARLAEVLRERADEAAAEDDCESLAEIRRANGAVDGSMLDPGIEDSWQATCG